MTLQFLQVTAAMTTHTPAHWSPHTSWSAPASATTSSWADYWYAVSSTGLLIAGAVTALGACAAIVFLLVQWRSANIRDAQGQWKASVLEMQAAQARKDMAEALERVATLNVEAARLQRKNLSLTALAQPRQLTGVQAHDVAEALTPDSGRSVTLWSYGFDPEGGALAEQIRQSLIEAHVVVINNIGQLSASERPRIGVQIAGADEGLVESLYKGFHSVDGLDAALVHTAQTNAEDAPPAEIFIGMKPFGRQSDAPEHAAFDARPPLAALAAR